MFYIYYIQGDNMTKYCKHCGSELPEGSIFCDECGKKTTATTSSASNGNLFGLYNINMMDGEVVIRHSQIHNGCLIPPLMLAGFGFLLGLFVLIFVINYWYVSPGFVFTTLFNLFTVVGIIWFIVRFIAYKTNDLILTNKRVFGKCGLITTTQMQSPLNRIDSVSYSSGLIGKIIGYGTVKIATASTVFKFRFVREGQSLYNDIFNQLEKSELENRDKNAKAIADAIADKN